MVSFLGYLYFHYNIRRPIWLKKKLSFLKGLVLISDVNCKDVSLMVDYLLRIVTSVQKSLLVDCCDLLLPHTQKSLLGEAQKVIVQKARFSLEKRGKTFIFRQPTL